MKSATFFGISLLLSLCCSLSAQADDSLYLLSVDEFKNHDEVQKAVQERNFNASLMAAAIFHASNSIRKKENLPPLTYAASLQKAASEHAEAMLSANFFGHINKRDRAGKTPALRVANAGGTFKSVAENIAENTLYQLSESGYIREDDGLYTTDGNPLEYHSYWSLAEKIVVGWMKSPGHRANLLGDYQYLGCGVSPIFTKQEVLPVLFAVQNFASQ